MESLLYPLLGVAGILALASLLPALARWLRVPYALALASVGIALGVLMQIGPLLPAQGGAAEALRALGGLELSSAAFLYIFLPALLFEAALGVDARRLLDDLAPVLLMAVIAVIVCTVVSGLVLWQVWGLWHGEASRRVLLACLLAASVIATTDPAAVLGVFKDLGAPKRLCSLVEGESLFNDAAAIVLFSLLLSMLTGSTSAGGLSAESGTAADAWAATLAFAAKFIGGIGIGWLLGWIAAHLCAALHDLPHSEIALTVALAYLSFIIGEHYVHVSGVVSVVTAGLVMASMGRTRISPDSWEGLHHVWGQLGFWANSLIFILAGMLVPPILARAVPAHGVLLAGLIAAALVARAIVTFGLLPLLSAAGLAHRIDLPYRLVMTWGGLRGAVSLALALAIAENRQLEAEIKDMATVVITGFVLFTLFVQGLSLRPLLRLLGLDRLPPLERSLRNQAMGLALGDVRRDLEGIARRFKLDPAQAIAPLLRRGADLAQERLDLDASQGAHADRQTDTYVSLSALARYERARYQDYFKDGVLSRRTASRLQAWADRLTDGLGGDPDGHYQTIAGRMTHPGLALHLSLWLHHRTGHAGLVGAALSEWAMTLMAMRFCLQDLRDYADQRLRPMLGAAAHARLIPLLQQRQAMTDEALDAIKLQYPAYMAAIQAQYLLRIGLRREERAVKALFGDGAIGPEIMQDLQADLKPRWREAQRPPHLDLGLATRALIASVPLFADAAPDRLRSIEKLLKPRLFLPGQRIVRQGDRGEAAFFIASGAVSVTSADMPIPIRLGTGQFFGEIALLRDQPRNADVTAIAYCRILLLDRHDFLKLYQSDPDLRADIDNAIRRRLGEPQTTPLHTVTPS
jgi:monovalent cation:H+ antiporter, CPA1 family